MWAKENKGRERILLPRDNYCISNLLVRDKAAFPAVFIFSWHPDVLSREREDTTLPNINRSLTAVKANCCVKFFQVLDVFFSYQCVALIIPLFSHGAKEISSLSRDYPRFILTDQLIYWKNFASHYLIKTQTLMFPSVSLTPKFVLLIISWPGKATSCFSVALTNSTSTIVVWWS